MEGTLIDIVLGLILIYLVLALLASKLQEMVFGQLFTNRVDVMHDMLTEATGHDAQLKQRLLDNPAIAALYQGSQATHSSMGRSSGPSAVPPDLFASALLAELLDDGKHSHPSTQYATPFAFIAAKADGNAIWGALRTMVSPETLAWPAFEAAIAKWFADIGNRADGWFKRKAVVRGLFVAGGVALAANANTFELIDRLSNEPILRRALASLAVRVDASVNDGKSGSGTSTAQQAPSPQERVNSALRDASAQLGAAYFGNKSFSGFAPDRQPLGNDGDLIAACAVASARIAPIGVPASGARSDEKAPAALSDPSTWIALLPPLRAYVREQRIVLARPGAPVPAAAAPSEPIQSVGKQVKKKSKPADAQDGARSAPAAAPESKDGLRTAYRCVGNLIGWVGIAQAANNSASLSSQLEQAGRQLENASDALLEWIDDEGTGLSVKRLFQANPDAFEECARSAPTLSRLRACVLAQNGALNWPLGWGEANRRLTLCKVVSGEAARGGGASCAFASAQYPGHTGLGIPPLAMQGIGNWELVFAGLGIAVTALFVALGAPFWFDALGRVVKLRASGPREDAGDGGGASSQPPPPPPGGAGGGGSNSPSGSPEPFADAMNDFERSLTGEDKRALQQKLGVPQTLLLDQITRNKLIDNKIENGELLSSAQYEAIVGHPPEQARRAAALVVPTGRGAPLPDAQALSDRLSAALGRTPPASVPAELTDELRAMAVLYRYRKEEAARGHTLLTEMPVVGAARIDGALDTIAPALVAELLALPAPSTPPAPPIYAPTATAPWLDYAIGELGQRAYRAGTRAASDPRIVSYLDAGGASSTADDTTPWCAAFVSWCLQRAGRTGPNDPKPSTSAGAFEKVGTQTWSSASAGALVGQRGDIVCFDWDGDKVIDHVAFVLEVDVAAGTVLAIGGNQGTGQHMVSVTSVPASMVSSICRL